MGKVRSTAVAGYFYPDDAQQLRSQLHGYLAEAKANAPCPKAFIAPHAGYIYSGAVAASAYARVFNRDKDIEQVVLMGPSHRVGFEGIATPGVDYFASPLGNIPVDRQAMEHVEELPFVRCIDRAHAHEHSLEVHLPFLQLTLNEFRLIPLVVGDARGAQVSQVLELLWGGEETLIVISSDLSHYLDYDSAVAIDSLTTKAIETLKGEDISYDQACGRIPVQGMLLSAKQHGLTCTTVDQRNSGDTAGPRDQVVGYGAYVFN